METPTWPEALTKFGMPDPLEPARAAPRMREALRNATPHMDVRPPDLAEVRGEMEVSAAARSHAGSFHDNAPTDLSIGHPPCHASPVREVLTQRAIATVYGGEFPDESWYDEVAYPQLCSSRPPLSEISLASEPDCPECSGDMLDLYWDIRRGECARLDNQHVRSPDIPENCLGFYDADGNFQPNGSRPNSPPNHHN